MKRSRVIIGIGAGTVLVYWGLWLLRSDETRIREMLDAMTSGFNDGSPAEALSGLDDSYVEETTKIKRAEIEQFLRWLSFTARDEKTKEFRHRVEVSGIEVAVEPEGKKGTLGFEAQFSELRAGAFQPVWRVAIEAVLEEREGWKVISSRHTALSGKRPF